MLSRHFSHPTILAPGPILSALKPSQVISVQVQLAGQAEIRANRTNGSWRLTAPISYPAQQVKIEAFLKVLSELVSVATISGDELRTRPEAEQDYGLAQPQAYLIVQQADFLTHIKVGALTTPGDQVFIQVVGTQGAFVVDAELLKLIPHTANAWRETTLLKLDELVFDRIVVTNNAKVFELQRTAAADPWRLTLPIPARADNIKIEEALQNLGRLEVREFVSDDPRADLEALGFRPPLLSIALAKGATPAAILMVGSSPTNEPAQVFARLAGSPAIMTITRDLVEPWLQPGGSYRDPFLVGPLPAVSSIQVLGAESFTLERNTNDSWSVMPQNLPADAWIVKNLIATLTSMKVLEYVKDVVTPPDLPAFGLAQPRRQYTLRAPGTTNVLVQVNFGTNTIDRAFASRADENSVYAVSLAEAMHLPASGWAVRERKFWNLDVDQVTGVTVEGGGKSTRLLRQAAHQWTLAPGSQGIFNELAIEETVRGLCQAAAVVWVAVGETNRAQFGFSENGRRLTLELKNGEKRTIEFGGDAPSSFPYAAVSLEKQLWIFEFPWPLYRDIQAYLPAPPAGS
jgi:hypothetical protein